jgi:hypothetical protein
MALLKLFLPTQQGILGVKKKDLDELRSQFKLKYSDIKTFLCDPHKANVVLDVNTVQANRNEESQCVGFATMQIQP